jgi:predicted enzyme related to lactoylglutathione lyase
VAEGLFTHVDCHGVEVSNLEAAIDFYVSRLGHALVWRSDTGAGLALRDARDMPELVLHTDHWPVATALRVDDVESAIERFVSAGGRLRSGPEDIPIGKLAVVEDPFGNALVMLDGSKGSLRTDPDGNVVGVS